MATPRNVRDRTTDEPALSLQGISPKDPKAGSQGDTCSLMHKAKGGSRVRGPGAPGLAVPTPRASWGRRKNKVTGSP